MGDEPRSAWWKIGDWAAKAYYPLAAVLILSIGADWMPLAYGSGIALFASLIVSVGASWLGYRAHRRALRRPAG